MTTAVVMTMVGGVDDGNGSGDDGGSRDNGCGSDVMFAMVEVVLMVVVKDTSFLLWKILEVKISYFCFF